MSYTSLHQFIQDKKRKEREALEEKFRQDDARLREEHQAYVRAEEEKRKAEREKVFGKNSNVRELYVVDNVPIIFRTNDFSEVVEMEVVKDLDQLSHQQRSQLHTLEPKVYGRLMSGLTNFQIDEEIMSRAFSMRMENFLDMAYCFELGRKYGYSDKTIDQMLETNTPAELEHKIKIANK